MDTKAIFIYNEAIEKVAFPPDCPYRLERAGKTRQMAESLDLFDKNSTEQFIAPPCDRILLKKFHTARYIQTLMRVSQGKWNLESLQMGIGTQDCPAFKGLYEYCLLVCGGTLQAAKLIIEQKAHAVFHPAGGQHNAQAEKAGGYDYINDVVLGCMELAAKGMKVFCLDVDAHHGDGLQQAFYERRDVFTVSLHENPHTLYPGTGFETETGAGDGLGYNVNLPLPVGTYDDAYLKVFRSVVIPLMMTYQPDVFVLVLGADSLVGDPLAHLHLTNNSLLEITNTVINFGKPVLVTGGGGYNVDDTVRAWTLAWTAISGKLSDMRLRVLKDPQLGVAEAQRHNVESAVQALIATVKKSVFSLHKL